ncbi:LysM peptidoglycan-binding domain-containing protein [Deinococcus radiomollis]|uniref:C40 family peptidase n=1 Tax=Deinococcus radiomollis TaxID=468916 RepID=UPI00389291F7
MPRFPLPVLNRYGLKCPGLSGLGLSLALLCGTLAGAAAGTQTYTVKPGDTAYSVARLAGTDPATLLSLNALSTPDLKPGQVLQLPLGQLAPAASRTHTVQAGQTLYSVARLYGLKAADVQEFNHLSGSDLKPGQVLTLPAEGVQATAPVSVPAVLVQAGPSAPAPQFPAQSVPALPLARHTVMPGQTLYAVARLYGLRPADLLTLNRLPGGELHVGQVLLLPAGVVAQASGVSQTPVASPGGTRLRNTSPASVAPDGALLSPGVPLPLPPSPNAPRSDMPQPPSIPMGFVAPEDSGSEGGWRGLAMSLLGVPYVYGGQSRGGTDCSGLVLQVFGPLGVNLPRQSAQQAQAGVPVAQADLQAGDLLFFDTEGRGTVTHVGIYLGEGAFINANSYGGQVAVNQLSDRYFAERYLWARRVLGGLAQVH